MSHLPSDPTPSGPLFYHKSLLPLEKTIRDIHREKASLHPLHRLKEERFRCKKRVCNKIKEIKKKSSLIDAIIKKQRQ